MSTHFFLLAFAFAFVSSSVFGITVEERLSELERIVALQSETLSKHERVIREQRDKLETVLNENEILKSRVEILENVIEHWKSNPVAGDGRNVLHDTEDGVQLMGDDNTHEADVSNGSRDGTFHRTLHKRQVPVKVAFHARRNGPRCVNDHEIVVYNNEVIDVGNGYNPGDGIYTVPVTGVYVFTWNADARHEWTITELLVNGQEKATSEADNLLDNEIVEATGVVVTQVNAGDHVFIRRSSGSPCSSIGSSYLATFSGWLLFQ